MGFEYLLVWSLSDFNVTPQKYESEAQCLQIKSKLEQNTQYVGLLTCVPVQSKVAEGVTFI